MYRYNINYLRKAFLNLRVGSARVIYLFRSVSLLARYCLTGNLVDYQAPRAARSPLGSGVGVGGFAYSPNNERFIGQRRRLQVLYALRTAANGCEWLRGDAGSDV